MSKLIVNEIIGVKVETIYNTDAVPATTDAVLVENIQWDNRGARMIGRPAVRSSLGQLRQIYGGSLFGLKFDVEIKGSGAAGTPPEVGALLQACRMSETIVASTSVTYKPSSGSGAKSVTIYYYADGLLYKMTGARGTFSASLKTGDKGMLSFDMVGHITGPTDTALITPSYDTTVPPALINVPFTVDTYAAIIEALAFDLGNNIQLPPSIAATDGYGEIQVGMRDVTGSFDPEVVAIATKDFMGQWRAGTAMALDTGVIGATAGNRYRVQMPAISYRDIAHGARGNIRTFKNGFGAAESTTDDEIQIQYS